MSNWNQAIASKGDQPGLEEFLNPRITPLTLDKAIQRRAIFRSLVADALPEFHGTVLDVGCGRMPYRRVVLTAPSRATRYIGADLRGNKYAKEHVDILWDGWRLPVPSDSVECVMATEVLEHCPSPELLIGEVVRALKPGGFFYFTVPFLWPLHDVPNDEYRFTPFSLERYLKNAELVNIRLKALGGWDASLGQMLGLWVRRRPMPAKVRRILSVVVFPVVRYLARHEDTIGFGESQMISGLAGWAWKKL
ncbi:MAG: class I SAM-dependent methyltransferase [Bryobacteraceae bacterium]